MSLRWQESVFADLTGADVYDLLRLRAEAFVVEQQCFYLDPDGLDRRPDTWHLLGRDGEGLLAYARILAPRDGGPAKIGRVVVAPPVRGGGVAVELMQRALDLCERTWGGEVFVQAQAHLEGFYGRLGFTAIGPVYDEDGIPHIDMIRRAG